MFFPLTYSFLIFPFFFERKENLFIGKGDNYTSFSATKVNFREF